MKKILARLKQWNNSNAGLTLVEVIVTMLILVVISLPILGGFIVAARANAMAKDMAYARDAAENVIEVANAGGLSEENFERIGQGWNCVLTSGNPETDNTFTYTVSNIREGSGMYTAEIVCNKATYTEANTYDLPDMTTLDAKETLVIFPESNFYKFDDEGNLLDASNLHRFDTTAINDFYLDYNDGILEIYRNVVYAAYVDQLTAIEEENQKRIGDVDPGETPDTLDLPVMPEYPSELRKADAVNNGRYPIKDNIYRTIDIKVVYDLSADAEDEDGVQATVSTEYSYEMRDNIPGKLSVRQMLDADLPDYSTDTNYTFIHDPFVFEESSSADRVYTAEEIAAAKQAVKNAVLSELEVAISALENRLKEPKNYKVAADTSMDTLNNIYLITYPFNAVPGSVINYNTLSLTAEVKAGIANNYLNDKEVGVFLVIQQDDKYEPKSENGDQFNIQVTNGSIFKFYSQMLLNPVGTEAPSAINNTLYNERENTEGNELLDVTIKVYNSDNVGAGKELTEVKSTISSKKQ